MLFGEKILDYWDDILKDLETLVAIPSVAKPQEGEHPYGDECARAIDTVIKMAEGYGLKAKTWLSRRPRGIWRGPGQRGGHGPPGRGPRRGRLGHRPLHHGHRRQPGLWSGRFRQQGPAIVALHCLRALKDAGVKGNRKLRVIFGSAEEIGMDDMPYYLSGSRSRHGLYPDASYGICTARRATWL